MSLVFFFFSSRRRHTRYWRDWSSDVCSSDLSVRRRRRRWPAAARCRWWTCSRRSRPGRSEERRVGKECRSRWSLYNQKKKTWVMLVLNLPFKALMFLTLMSPSLVLFLVLLLKLVKDFLKVRCMLALLPFLISRLIWLDLVASLPLIKERILVIILLLH